MSDSSTAALPSSTVTERAGVTIGIVQALMARAKVLNWVWLPGAILSMAASSFGVFIYRGYWPWEPPPGGMDGVLLDSLGAMVFVGGTSTVVVGGLFLLSQRMLMSFAVEQGLEPELARDVVKRMDTAHKPKLGERADEAMLAHILKD